MIKSTPKKISVNEARYDFILKMNVLKVFINLLDSGIEITGYSASGKIAISFHRYQQAKGNY